MASIVHPERGEVEVFTVVEGEYYCIIIKTQAGKYFWRIAGRNGFPVCDSASDFDEPLNAKRSAKRMLRAVSAAPLFRSKRGASSDDSE